MTSFKAPPADLNELKDRVKLLLKEGWCQGAMAIDTANRLRRSSHGDDICNVCLVGAVNRAAMQDRSLDADIIRDNFLDIFELKHDATPIYFNDRIAKSVDDVIAAVEAL